MCCTLLLKLFVSHRRHNLESMRVMNNRFSFCGDLKKNPQNLIAINCVPNCIHRISIIEFEPHSPPPKQSTQHGICPISRAHLTGRIPTPRVRANRVNLRATDFAVSLIDINGHTASWPGLKSEHASLSNIIVNSTPTLNFSRCRHERRRRSCQSGQAAKHERLLRSINKNRAGPGAGGCHGDV